MEILTLFCEKERKQVRRRTNIAWWDFFFLYLNIATIAKIWTKSGAHNPGLLTALSPRGGYSHTLPIRLCAAQRGRDFEAPDLERGIHFRGVF